MAEAEAPIWTDHMTAPTGRQVRRWIVGTAVPVLALPTAIYCIPMFKKTREGVTLGACYPAYTGKRATTVLPVWQFLVGGVGLWGSFGAINDYIRRHSNRLGPYLVAFRTPWAALGAVLSAQLCYNLAPEMLVQAPESRCRHRKVGAATGKWVESWCKHR